MNDIPLGPRRIEDRPSADDQAISRLLRVVGPRHEVPEDAVALAREAARAEWQRKVKQAAQRRRFRRAGVWLAVAATALLALGLVLRLETETVLHGAGDQASSLLLGKASVRIAQGTELDLVSSSETEIVLRLERGAVYVDTIADQPTVIVQTALGDFSHVGTQFEVRILEESGAPVRLRVREGRVSLVDDAGSRHLAEAETELILEPDGTVTRATVAAYGPHWDWVLELAPAFDINGKTLSAFLDWLCREGGWELRWDPESLAAQKGPGIQFFDFPEELAPLEAAEEIILPSNGLSHRLEGGVLFVESL